MEAVNKLQQQYKAITALVEVGELQQADEKLQLIADYKTIKYYELQSMIMYQKEDFISAEDLLQQALVKFPYAINLNYNYAMIKLALGDLEEAAKGIMHCAKYAEIEEERLEFQSQLQEILQVILNEDALPITVRKEMIQRVKESLLERDAIAFPLDNKGRSLIKKTLTDKNNQTYFIDLYKAFAKPTITEENRIYFKTETVKGTITNEWTVDAKTTSILPLSLIEDETSVTINDEEIKGLHDNQINYLQLPQGTAYSVNANKPTFLGNAITTKDKRNKVPQIITLFVDGLSNNFLQHINIAEIAPNITNYFAGGYRNNACYATGEWTLTGVAGMFSMKNTLHHGIFHPIYDGALNTHNELATSNFAKAGYYMAQISNNTRMTPTYGYFEDFDRIVYQTYAGGFKAGEVVAEAIEHLATFRDKNNFLWVSFEDLHDVADELHNDILSQSKTNYLLRKEPIIGDTSILTPYDSNKIEKYKIELARLDTHIGVLINYIIKTFGEEVIVALVSDHGQSFIDNDEFLLHEGRCNVPFMLRGQTIAHQVSDEIMSNTDIFATLAHIANVPITNLYDAHVPRDFGGDGREVAMTETRHPDQPYRLMLKDIQHTFRFQTTAHVSRNGELNLQEYTYELVNNITKQDEQNLYSEKVNSRLQYIQDYAIDFHHFE